MSPMRLHWPRDQFQTCATQMRCVCIFSTTHLSVPTMNKDTKKERRKSKVKDEQTGGENSKWSEADDALLVETMTLQKAEGGWGDNNPKPIAWTACEKALARSEKESGGACKGITVLKSRWQKVCLDYVLICMYLTICSSNRNMTLSRSSAISQDSAGTMRRSMSRCFQVFGKSTSRYA